MRRSDHNEHLPPGRWVISGFKPRPELRPAQYCRFLLYNTKEVKATTEEVEVYINFDRLPGGIGRTKDDPFKQIGAADVARIQQWIRRKVSGEDEVFAVISGRAYRFVNMVATAELASCKIVVKIGWSQAGMVPIVVKDFRRNTR